MITKSQKVLLMAIRAALFGTKPSYPADTDWDEVVKEAKAQAVLGIISPVIPVHDESVEQGKANYMRILYEQDQLIKLFDEHNIPCVILKGTAAAIYYPKPYLRAMGDVDILVPRNKFYEAVEIMESNCYIYTHGKIDGVYNQKESRHIGYSKNGIEFELHHHFSSKGFDVDDILEKAIQKREYCEVNGFRFPMLPEIENGLVLIGHVNHHLKNNNLGLRQIIDWEMYFDSVMKKEAWSKFAFLVKNAGLLRLTIYITLLCEKHLGLSKKIHLKNINDLIIDEHLKAILTDGNFGKREVSLTKMERKIRDNIYGIRKEGFFIHFQEVGLYSWKLCKKHPSLKPFAFIYGMLRSSYNGIIALFKTREIAKHINEAKYRQVLYRKIGIKFEAKKK